MVSFHKTDDPMIPIQVAITDGGKPLSPQAIDAVVIALNNALDATRAIAVAYLQASQAIESLKEASSHFGAK